MIELHDLGDADTWVVVYHQHTLRQLIGRIAEVVPSYDNCCAISDCVTVVFIVQSSMLLRPPFLLGRPS